MTRGLRTALGLGLVAALGLAAAACSDDDDGAATSQATTADGPVFADELQGLVRDDPLLVGDVTLPVAGTGEARAMQAEEGELLVAYFGYLSCPDVCPTSMSDLEKALDVLGEEAADVEVSFTTVDPARDTPDLMAEYLSFFFDRWLALRTEDPAELRAAEDAFLVTSSVTTTEDGTVEVEHSGQMFVVSDEGEVLVEWPFGTSSDAMASDLALLLDTATGPATADPTGAEVSGG